MSVLKWPEPSGWSTSRRRLILVSLSGLVIVSASAALGVRALLRGEYANAVGFSGLCPLPVVTVLWLFSVQCGRTSLRTEYDPTGTTLRPDRRFTVATCVGLIVFVCAMALLFVLIRTGKLDDVSTMIRGVRTSAQALTVVGVTVGILGLITAWRRGGVGYVKLTPSGCDLADIAHTDSIAWNDITDITDTSASKKTRKAVVFCLRDGGEKILDGADFYVPNGVGLYWMVRRYWRRPQDRAELTDGRAADRLREQQFPLQ